MTTNILLTPSIIAKEALMQLLNELAMSRNVYREYKNEFAKVGGTITIRKPNKFRATKTDAISKSTIAEPSTTLTVSTPAHVAWEFSSTELTLTIEEYSKRYVVPGCQALGNTIDDDLCSLYKKVAQSAGTPGTTPATFGVLGDCQTILSNGGVPSASRVGILNPNANWALADGLKGTFAQQVAKDIITKGYLGTIADLSLYQDQNIQRHTTGHFTTDATPVMNGATLTDATTLVTNGWGGSNDVHVGDVFTISGVYAVNPMTGKSTGALMQFVVTAQTDDVAGDMTIPISPTIVYGATNPYSNVSALPANGAVLTFMGTEDTEYPQNLIFRPEAFALATIPVEMPAGVWGARETDPESGLSVRIVKQFDIDTNKEVARLDVLYGMDCIYPELCVRLWG
jgi:hypothetical protein